MPSLTSVSTGRENNSAMNVMTPNQAYGGTMNLQTPASYNNRLRKNQSLMKNLTGDRSSRQLNDLVYKSAVVNSRSMSVNGIYDSRNSLHNSQISSASVDLIGIRSQEKLQRS